DSAENESEKERINSEIRELERLTSVYEQLMGE
ncbi:MAG: hypothetical protein RLZ10_249, partial [Bacteroidota bacterium]